MIVNPTTFSWDGATQRVDDTDYLATDRKGYDLAIKPTGAADDQFVVIMGVISTDQHYVAPLADLANPIEKGAWTAGVREVDVYDIRSDWAEADFVMEVAPKPPTNFIIA